MERVERVSAEPVEPEARQEKSIKWLRDSRRGSLARTLESLLKTSRREARKAKSSADRLRWVKTICYITQTYNSLLRDTDYDELKRQVTLVQEKVIRVANAKSQGP